MVSRRSKCHPGLLCRSERAAWLYSAVIAEVDLEPVALPFAGSVRFFHVVPQTHPERVATAATKLFDSTVFGRVAIGPGDEGYDGSILKSNG